MKRNIWGYDKKKTSEYIESLEEQIDILNSKLAVLTIELNNAKEELKSRQHLSEATQETPKSQSDYLERITELEIENKKIVEKYNQLIKENNQLKKEKEQQINLLKEKNELLSSKLNELEKSSNNAASFLVSMSTERALSQAEKIRTASREEIMKYVDEYVDVLEKTNEKLKEIIKQLRSDYKLLTDELSDSIGRFTESLWIMDTFNARIEKGIIPVDEILYELKSKLDLLWKQNFLSVKEKRSELSDISGDNILALKTKNEDESSTRNQDEEAHSESSENIIDDSTKTEKGKEDFLKEKSDIIQIKTNVKSTEIFRPRDNT